MKIRIPHLWWVMMGFWILIGTNLTAQIQFKLELLSDELTYQVSMVPDITWAYPLNLTSSAQITIRVPHGNPPNSFVVQDLTSLQLGSDWDNNTRIDAPPEAPNWDYISFALISFGTDAFNFEEGVEIPVFSFQNGADACTDSIELVNNINDPFLPPNSSGANIGHAIVTLGGGLMNAFSGVINTGKAPCVPETNCEETPTETNVSICGNETYQGYFYQNDTTLIQHFLSVNGCDSMVTTFIDVTPNYDVEFHESICLGEMYHGQNYFEDIDIVENLLTEDGCDSTVLIHLTILHPSITNIDTSLCYGTMYHGNIIETDTTFFETLEAENGCDSVIYNNVSVYDVEIIEIDTIICKGDSIFGSIFAIDTLLEQHFLAANGCDSLVLNYYINVIPSSQTYSQVLLIEGNNWLNVSPDSDTTIIQNLTGYFGCDSIATTDILVFPPNAIILDSTICQGQMIGGFFPSIDTIFTDTLFAANSSDSLLVFNLTVLPSATNMMQITLCDGEDFMGITWAADTILTEVFNGSSSCDSVAIYELTVIPPLSTSYENKICGGELINGILYSNDTLIIDTLTAISGCDSLHYEFIEVLPNPTPEIFGVTAFCKGETVNLSTNTFVHYEWNTGSIENNINIEQTGLYSITVTDLDGCTGTTTFASTMTEFEVDLISNSPNCQHLNSGSIHFEAVLGGHSPYIYSINNGSSFQSEPFFENISAGDYALIIEDANGCQWEEQTVISEPNELQIEIEQASQILDLGDSIWLNVGMNTNHYDTIIWKPASSLSCADCPNPIVTPLQTTDYTVEVISDGCQAEASILITIAKRKKVFWPNVFSPNGDGINDFFYLQAGSDVKRIGFLRIFDRNGMLVFEREAHFPNDPKMGWTGQSRGQKNNSGVFVFIAEVEFINGQREIFKGDFTLLK